MTTREDIAEIPGAELRYRLAGTPGTLPTIVLENGWGASYDYFALLQEALAPHTQLLLYNRAGIGGSMAHETLTAEGMSRHLAALLDALGIRAPVVIAGQSYGGLICGVHAALMPQRLRAVVQIDPTAERTDEQIDATLGSMRGLGKVLRLLAALRIPEPFFAPHMPELPAADTAQLRRNAFGNAASLRAAGIELDLLQDIRRVCAQPSPVPRLVISAGTTEEVRNALFRLLVSPERARSLLGRMQAQHEITAGRGGPGSRWITLPHTHGALVVSRSGAAATATCMIDYLSSLPTT
ncbi:MAG TPA: alpha/beta fold hydrolase [Nevskiaceae bacterium]|nr:alpha/beta fold hydrolase [Nevskiaceae bacterium]